MQNTRPCPEVIKRFFMRNSAERRILNAHTFSIKYQENKHCSGLDVKC